MVLEARPEARTVAGVDLDVVEVEVEVVAHRAGTWEVRQGTGCGVKGMGAYLVLEAMAQRVGEAPATG